MAQSQCILINSRRKLIEDRGKRFFVQLLSSFQQRNSLFHRVALSLFCSILCKTWIDTKGLQNSIEKNESTFLVSSNYKPFCRIEFCFEIKVTVSCFTDTKVIINGAIIGRM